MAMTTAEYSKIVKDNTLGWILDNFLMESNPAQQIPFDTDKGLAVTIPSWGTLPSVGWRNVNGSYTESSGTYEHKVEEKYIFGGYIDTDKVLADAGPTIVSVRQDQRKMKAKAMAFEFNDVFINGVTTSKQFKGISARITDIYAAGYTDHYIDGGSATTGRGFLYDTTDRNLFLDNLNKLIHALPGHKANALYMNAKCYLAVESCLRREGLLNTAKDMFEREIETYRGATLIDIGVKADQTTEIITNGEGLSGGTDETSIYAVRYGASEFLWGIQQKAMESIDMGLQLVSGKPVYQDFVEWVVGLAIGNPRSIARLYGLVPDAGAS